jgi:hypothetical protein
MNQVWNRFHKICSGARESACRKGKRAYAPRMRRSGRALIGYLIVLGAAACNIYTPALLDDGDISSGGSSATAGFGGATGGGAGGFAGVVGPVSGGAPPSGGAAGAFSTGGSATDGGSAGSETAGTGGVDAGGSGAAGDGAGGTAGGGAGGASAGGAAGGSAGSGTVTDPCVDPPAGVEELIDDFEDEDQWLLPGLIRNGLWFLFNDGTVAGQQGPDPLLPAAIPSGETSAVGSTRVLHTTASGFTVWGTGLGADFIHEKEAPYDARAYAGITFWAKVGTGSETRVRFVVPDSTTEPAGGKCNNAANAPNNAKCSNHFGVNLILTDSWRKCRVDFADLRQIGGWGLTAPALNAAELYGLQFTIRQNSLVDFWLDDVAFVLK